MTAVMLAGGVAAATAGPANAAESKTAGVQATCYGSAKKYTGTPGKGKSNAHWPGTGKYAYATKTCKDINVKVDKTRQVKTCFKKTKKCNGWTTARKGKWTVVASNVRDGAGFYLQFKGTPRSTGWIAY
ncbi:hypothetical protein Sipo8835_43925 [Streptomyces ipomoeae]|nr:hypothetical protein Sipo8835_43925 [Streptomyces ipomoeae]TQE23904.1 hypothetical protein SipoB123_19985 [Streptomyces ipomoeae]TQE40540.1 hypothetical protein Sipo7851_00475 [Streptomyces ipomoeae]